MKKLICLFLSIFFAMVIFVGCGNKTPVETSETQSSLEFTTEATTEESIITSNGNTLIAMDPANEYSNHQFIYYFNDDDELTGIEYIIVFDNSQEAQLAYELYNAYAQMYEFVSLDGNTLTVSYGEEMRLEYSGLTKQLLENVLISQGYTIVN